MTRVVLRPTIAFSGARLPTDDEMRAMHDAAHHECFLANSVRTESRRDGHAERLMIRTLESRCALVGLTMARAVALAQTADEGQVIGLLTVPELMPRTRARRSRRQRSPSMRLGRDEPDWRTARVRGPLTPTATRDCEDDSGRPGRCLVDRHSRCATEEHGYEEHVAAIVATTRGSKQRSMPVTGPRLARVHRERVDPAAAADGAGAGEHRAVLGRRRGATGRDRRAAFDRGPGGSRRRRPRDGKATLTLAGGQQVAVKYCVFWALSGGDWRWHADIWNAGV